MVKIISDSTCDLTPELIEKYDISILPLHILMGELEYEDGLGITPNEIFKWADANRTTPKTSAPSIERAAELIKSFTDNGTEVVCFSISAPISASGNVMRLAAEDLGVEHLVTVIDSANLSTGLGLLVVEGAIMAQEGKTSKEIKERIEELKPLVRTSFVVDTLTYLHRGGRCSGLAALAGGALKLHPKILLENGEMHPGKKYRGKIDKVIMAYVSELEADLRNAKTDRVFVTHSVSDRALVEKVKEYIHNLNVFTEVLEAPVGGVICSHCGPGTLGVIYIASK